MTREQGKIATQIDKMCKLGKKYNLKSVEVADSFIKIEFNEQISSYSTKKVSRKDKAALEDMKKQLDLEELQILDPAAYEEELIKQEIGLREI